MKLARDQAQQRRLARAVAPDKANFMAFGDGGGRVLEQRPPFDAETQIVDMQHGRKMLRKPRLRNLIYAKLRLIGQLAFHNI